MALPHYKSYHIETTKIFADSKSLQSWLAKDEVMSCSTTALSKLRKQRTAGTDVDPLEADGIRETFPARLTFNGVETSRDSK